MLRYQGREDQVRTHRVLGLEAFHDEAWPPDICSESDDDGELGGLLMDEEYLDAVTVFDCAGGFER